MAFGLLLEDAEQGGAGGITQPHHTVSGGIALPECHRRHGCHGTGAHGGDPIGVDEGEEFTRFGIVEQHVAAEAGYGLKQAVHYLDAEITAMETAVGNIVGGGQQARHGGEELSFIRMDADFCG